MGMKKAGAVAEQPLLKVEGDEVLAAKQPESGATAANLIATKVLSVKTETEIESGATAAIERLSKTPGTIKTAPAYKARDYDAEALGKTRCVMFAAALQSPALAGLRFDDAKGFIAFVKEAADAGVAYSFQK